jgi:RND family efflux transporter MFP subunit
MFTLAGGFLLMVAAGTAIAETDARNTEQTTQVKVVRYGDIAYLPEHSTAAVVIAKHNSQIAAETSAAVTGVYFDTGEKVKLGDTVIALDCRSNEFSLKQALATHEATMAQYNNAKKLLASGKKLQVNNSMAQEVFNQREADAARLKAETNRTWAGVETARLSVEHCNINAPYDGYISKRFVSLGELVQPGTPVFNMVMTDKSEIEANISAEDYVSFLNGQGYEYSYRGSDYPVELINILPVIDPDYRTHTARLKFTADAAPTGSNGSLHWTDSQYAVPPNLVILRDGRYGLMIANDGKAAFKAIEDYVEGLPGLITLPDDTQIITTGRHGLKTGDHIRITP